MNTSKYSQQRITQKVKSSHNEDNISFKDGNSLNNANAVSLKGKLFSIEEEANNVSNDIQANQTDANLLKTEKESIHAILRQKLSETKSILTNQIDTLKDSMKRYYEDQNRENNKYLQQLDYLKKEKAELNSKVIQLENRLKELEDVVGVDDY